MGLLASLCHPRCRGVDRPPSGSLTAEKPDSGSREGNVLRFLIQSDQINSHHEVNLGLITCDTTEVHNVPTCQLCCLPASLQH